jgi:sec-independent protein translocase protein TatA
MNTLALSIPSGMEMIWIFLIVLLLFGAKRLPELFKSLGKSIREFKKATTEIEEDIRTAMDEEPEKPVAHTTNSEQAPKQVEAESAEVTESVDAPAEGENTDKI